MKVITALFIGVVLGVLFAPKSGKETRNYLMGKGEELMETSRENISDVVKKTKDITQSGKQKIGEIKEAVRK